mgnify:CR=1 FL=1
MACKIIMHIDLNAFFVSCEIIKNPSLKGKCILIGHSGRSGIVSTASYEARKKGCYSGQPMFMALRKCKEAIVIEGDYDFYNVMSNSFFSFLKNYSKIIEVASIDEGYVDMSAVLSKEKDPIGYLRKMQFELKKETGLGCSIGIAPTKWLAKMASDLKKPMGLTLIRKKDIKDIIYPLPIESFWGIGKKSAPRLKSMGINSIGDLANRINANDPILEKEFGKFYYTIKSYINGTSSDIVDTSPFDPKSIGNSKTLPFDSIGFNEVEKEIKYLCFEVSSRAKEERKVGKLVSLSVKDTNFNTHSKNKTLDYPTQDEQIIYNEIKKLYLANFNETEVRLVGVTLGKLTQKGKERIQMSLWNYQDYEEKDKTKLLIDSLNRKMNKKVFMKMGEIEKNNGNK